MNQQEGTTPSFGKVATGLVFLLLFAAGTALRFRNLAMESLWFDEIFSAQLVLRRSLVEVMLATFRMDFHPFGYYALLDIWTDFTGCDDWSLRALSAGMGAAALAAAFALCRAAFRCNGTALLCCLLLAVNPAHLRYSQEVRMYALEMLMWPALLACICYAIRKKRLDFLPALGIFACFTFFAYAHGTAGPVAIPFLLLVAGIVALRLFWVNARHDAWMVVATAGACLVAYAPWALRLLSLASAPKELDAFGWSQCAGLFYWLLMQDRNWALGMTASMVLLAAVAACILVLLFFQRKRAAALPLALVFASLVCIPLMQYALDLYKPNYQERNLAFLVVPFLALIAYLFVSCFRALLHLCARKEWPKAWAGAALAPLLVLVVAMSVVSVRASNSGHGREPWRPMIAEMSQQMTEGDVVVFYADYMNLCWHFYRAFDDCREAEYGIRQVNCRQMGIPKSSDAQAFEEGFARVIGTATELNEDQHVWVFYSHVSDAASVHARFQRSGLSSVSVMEGPSLSVYQYQVAR